MNPDLSDFSAEDLEAELQRRRQVQEEIQRRIYAGELDAVDGEDIHDDPRSWRNQ